MEACIVICRTNKPIERRGKVLFINARDEVTRKNAFSYLEDSHIQKIAGVYHSFQAVDGFSAIADTEEIQNHDSKLSIALYVTGGEADVQEEITFSDAAYSWMDSSDAMHEEIDVLMDMLGEG